MGLYTNTAESSTKSSNSNVNKIQRYPKSFLKVILFGFSLVGIPPIIALINSAITIDNLAAQSRDTVYQATQITHGNRILVDETLAMERSLRQALILSDSSLLEGYFLAHKKFDIMAEKLTGLSLPTEHKLLLKKTRLSEAIVYKSILEVKYSLPNFHDQIEDFSSILDSVKDFTVMGNILINQEVDKMLETANQARANVGKQLIALIPFVIALAVIFSFAITRPIRQIDEAIYNMGQGQLSKPIHVGGPQSLEYLGSRLDWMRRRLLKLEEQKIQFLRHVSHELKTPLTAIREGADLLAEGVTGTLSKQQQLIADILHSSSLQLQKRIEDLLSYSAIQAEKTTLVKNTVNLSKIIDHVLQNQNLSIMSKELTINRNCPNLIFECDEDKIQIILDNVLSNAVKFSPPKGSIDIHATKNNESIQVDIIDTGVGIHDTDKEKIFAPFYQGQLVPNAHVRGTGLGLSIAREFALAHGGDIKLIQQTGGGARFRLILPISDIEETI